MSDRNGDRYTFSESTSTSNSQPVYTSKQYAYQIDQNNGSYGSKQIIFDLSGFYNSQRFIDPREMFMMFPVLSTLTSVGPDNTHDGLGAAPKITYTNKATLSFGDNDGQVTDQYAMGMKSGSWHLINSIQIQVDGKDVIQLTPNINYHASFVANSTWSDSDTKKHSALTGYYPDSCDSWTVQELQSDKGLGVCNNALPPVQKLYPYPTNQHNIAVSDGRTISSRLFHSGVSTQCGNRSANEGLWKRMQATNSYNASDYITGIQALPCGAGQTNKLSYPARAALSCLDKGYGVTWATQNGTIDEASLRLLLQNRLRSNTIANVPTTNVLGLLRPEVLSATDSDSSASFRQLMTTCIVRFKDVCDLFNNLPLTRGLYMRVILNMNTGYTKINVSGSLLGVGALANVGYPSYDRIESNTFPGTCPIMLTPMQVSALAPQTIAQQHYTDAGFDGVFPDHSNYQLYPGVACDSGTNTRTALLLSVSIATPDPIHSTVSQLPAGLMPSHDLLNCRIFAPIIDMEPALTNSYITAHKDQAIYYRDVLAFRYPTVGKGAFTYQIANGIVNAKRLIVIPFYNQGVVTYTTAPATTDITPTALFQPCSPFDSAPATTAPQAALIDFNVLVSNMNIFQRNVSYDFENFIAEISPANAINGGLDTGLTSGMIGQYEWTQNYRYYVVDLSRRLAGDNTPKSLTIVGNNQSKFPVDYYFFVEYERHLSLDVESGHISVSSN